MLRLHLLLLCLICATAPLTVAAEVRVAVASNFAPLLHDLAGSFEQQTGHRLLLSSASTGKLYAQIRNGAAFDVFLAADVERPQRLVAQGFGQAEQLFVYAEGALVLWVPGATGLDPPHTLLTADSIRRVAIANPRLAPYGAAAQQVLQQWGLWGDLQRKLVRGENIAQAFQYVATGNAQAGLVALAQVLALPSAQRGSYRVIPADLHAPISQAALLLRRTPAAEAFVAFLRSDPVAQRMRAAGYRVPGLG